MLAKLWIHKKREINFSCSKRKAVFHASQPNQVLEIDLTTDTLWDMRETKALIISDSFNKQVLQIGTDCYLPDLGLLNMLEDLKKTSALPGVICINESVGLLSLNIDLWCLKNNLRLAYMHFPAWRARVLPKRNKKLLKFTPVDSFKTVREAAAASDEMNNRLGKAWFQKSSRR